MTELMPSLCNDCVARNQCGNDDVKMCVSYIKEVKIKCDDCKFVEDCVDYGWEGCKKFTPAPSTPMTNEEWRKICSAEEFAEWMAQYCCDVNTSDVREILKNEWLVWLKQPHTIKE